MKKVSNVAVHRPCLSSPLPFNRLPNRLAHAVMARILIIAALLVLMGCGQETPLNPLPKQAVILAFGDSLTHGTGAGRGEGYPEVLTALSGHKVVNAGVPGEETDAGLGRLPRVLEEVQPALVIIGHGGNDMLRRRDLVQTEEHLRRMVALAHAQGAQVVLLGVPKPGIFLGTHPMYRRLADSLKLPLEADALAEILAEPGLKSDAIHPNADGYNRLAEALYRLLLDSGAL